MTLAQTGWKALRKAISVACGIVIGNLADPVAGSVQSWPFWKHMLIMTACAVLVAEASYWKSWADAANGGNSNAGKT